MQWHWKRYIFKQCKLKCLCSYVMMWQKLSAHDYSGTYGLYFHVKRLRLWLTNVIKPCCEHFMQPYDHKNVQRPQFTWWQLLGLGWYSQYRYTIHTEINQYIIDMVIKLYIWKYNFTPDFHTLKQKTQKKRYIEYDLNYVELCEKNYDIHHTCDHFALAKS